MNWQVTRIFINLKTFFFASYILIFKVAQSKNWPYKRNTFWIPQESPHTIFLNGPLLRWVWKKYNNFNFSWLCFPLVARVSSSKIKIQYVNLMWQHNFKTENVFFFKIEVKHFKRLHTACFHYIFTRKTFLKLFFCMDNLCSYGICVWVHIKS